ncbi:MAG: hypothetical protein ACJAUG_001973 [Halioglobus sp.]|jgi:hypothetical protein
MKSRLLKIASLKASLIAILLLCSACSSTTFVYNRLDFLIPWYLDDYVELNRVQERTLDELLVPYLDWHRAEELPRYVDILTRIESNLDQPLEQQNIVEISASAETAFLRVEERALEWLLTLGADLSDEQIEDFIAALREQQSEYEEKYLDRDLDEYYEDAYDNLRDNFQDYLGRLDSQQKQMMKSTSAELQRADSVWLEERAAWVANLERVLLREPGWQQELRVTLDRRYENHSESYVQVYEHNLNQVQALAVAVLNSRSEKQDRRLRKKLVSFREDLLTLIEQGNQSQPSS